MIVSASRRTDIPAFYSDWFFKRLEDGFCLVANPLNSKQISRIELNEKSVDGFVFWTRNPLQMIDKLHIIDDIGIPYYFLFTINNYPKKYEPNLTSVKNTIDIFHSLSELIGSERVIWRYDPVFFTSDVSIDFHLENFEFLATALKFKTKKVISSIITNYRKTTRRMLKLEPLFIDYNSDHHQYLKLFSVMKNYAEACGMQINVCAPDFDLSRLGIASAKCIDEKIFNTIAGKQLKYKKDKSQRTNCNCTESRDIGMNNSCLAGCEYCYAVVSQKYALNNFSKINSVYETFS